MENETFYLGQIFQNSYPLEASNWCTSKGDVCILEIAPAEDGTKLFQIVKIPEYEQTPEDVQYELTMKVQNFLDETAKKLGYDSCLSVCSYVDTGVVKFDEEGEAFRKWRSAVWAKGYEIVAEVQAGTREVPTEEELFAELPAIELDREELKA